MFGRGYTSAVERLVERQIRRELEFHNSATGRLMRRELERFNSTEFRVMQEHMRLMNNPAYQSMLWTVEHPGQSVHERRLWYYRKVFNVLTFEDIRKAVNKLLEQLFPKYDLELLSRRIRAVLSTQDKCNGVIKSHSPPVRLIPKTLHPVSTVA